MQMFLCAFLMVDVCVLMTSQSHYQYLWQHLKGSEEADTLAMLPAPLAAEVSQSAFGATLKLLPVGRRLGAELLRRLAPLLQPCIYSPGDIIIERGEAVVQMFVLKEVSHPFMMGQNL